MLPRVLSGPEYWSVPLVLAFEAQIDGHSKYEDEHDGVPRDAAGVLISGARGGWASRVVGGSCKLPGEQPVVVAYLETIRDFGWTDTSPARATIPADAIYPMDEAHDVLHALSLGHDGGIMCSSLNLYRDTTITQKQRLSLRTLDRPRVLKPNDVICPSGKPPARDCCPQQR